MAVSVEAGSQNRDAAPIAVEDIEIQLLLEGLAQFTGHDFRNHDPALIKRRVEHCMRLEDVGTVSALQERALHDADCLGRVLAQLALRRSGFFLDPPFYRSLREHVIPRLRTYPFVRIWHVGCGNGEETVSLAIALQEEGLYDRCRVYATDSLEAAIGAARSSVYGPETAEEWRARYASAGGRATLEAYAVRTTTGYAVKPQVLRNVVYAKHNVASDASFNDFHLIVCRQVLSQFKPAIQSKINRLLYQSLVRLGLLALGSGEALRHAADCEYRPLESAPDVYRRMR